MPRVPEYNLPEVAPQGLPGVRQEAAYNGDMLATGARQVQAMGQAGMQLGTELAKEAIDAQDMANQVRVKDNYSQLESYGNALKFGDPKNGIRGFASFKSKDALAPDPDTGQPLDATFTDKLKAKISDLSSDLSNDAQRRVFNMHANDYLTGFQGQVQSHMLGESVAYTREVNTGVISQAADTAALNWNDPDIIDRQVKNAQAAAYDQSVHDGLPGAAQTMAIKQASSATYRRVIEAALENNNPVYAMGLLDKAKNTGQITGDDMLAVQGKITHQVDALTAQGVVNVGIRELSSQIAPTELDRLRGVRDALESGGKDFNTDGTPVSSTAGALYKNQVRPATAKNPGFGIKPAADDSPAEYNRVGDDLLTALVNKYGDAGKALAAYNAGSGAVDAAIKAAPNNWLAQLPAETQAYVAKGVSKFNTGADAPPFPTKMEFVSRILAKLPDSASANLMTLTRAQAEAQYALLDQSRKEQGEQALDAVQKALVANGGNYSALPPTLTANLTRYASGRVDDAMKFAKAISNGENATNTEAYAMAMNYPGELAKMTDATFVNFLKTNFSVRDQEAVSKLRANEINGKTDDSSGALNYKAMNEVLANRLLPYNIVIPQGAEAQQKNLPNAQQVGAIQHYVADSIFDQQQQLGRKMTKDELAKHIDGMFAKDVWFKSGILGSLSSQPLLPEPAGHGRLVARHASWRYAGALTNERIETALRRNPPTRQANRS